MTNPNKRVAFSTHIVVHPVITQHEDLTEEETRNIWLNDQDKKRIRKDCMLNLASMLAGESILDEERYCYRGILSRNVVEKSRYVRKTSIFAVKEQQRQRREADSEEDQEAISRVYREVLRSKKCQEDAKARAVADSLEVESLSLRVGLKRCSSAPNRRGATVLITPTVRPTIKRVSSLKVDSRELRQMVARAS